VDYRHGFKRQTTGHGLNYFSIALIQVVGFEKYASLLCSAFTRTTTDSLRLDSNCMARAHLLTRQAPLSDRDRLLGRLAGPLNYALPNLG
jgi:hypothetical protein